jgi:hypothetical protein
MNDAVKKQTRKLYDWEVEEFRPLFGNTLKYTSIRIHELTPWPDKMDRLGRKLKGMPPPSANSHNAITLGNHCYFPIQLPEILVPLNHPDSYKLDWLVHELTHCWQFQNIGWKYLGKALLAQFREKENVYEYGGADGLIRSRQKGINFNQLNPEQQGNLVQAYYLRKRKGQDVIPWEPYIDDLKSAS